MKTIILSVVLLLAGGPSSHAALVRLNTDLIPKSIPPAPHGQKFLFVVDVSNSMERFEGCGRQTLFDLINSGMNNQMHVGDSFGVWAFNEKLISGEFPVQVWEPTNRLFLATSSSNYLSSLKYEDRSRLDIVVQSLSNIVHKVQDLNVIIISDDRAKLKGTAFDNPINDIYRKRSREMKKENKPFVTSLLFREGQLSTGQAVLTGEAIKLPKRTPPLPWPPAPISKTNETRQVKSTRPKTALNEPGRTIMITKQTIQRDRDELQASLNASFVDQPSNSARSNEALIGKSGQSHHEGETASNGQKSFKSPSKETNAAPAWTTSNIPPEPQVASDSREAPLPAVSQTSPRPNLLVMLAREAPARHADSSTRQVLTPNFAAIANPPTESSSSWYWICLGSGCLVVGIALFVLSLSRRRLRISSITRSMHY